MEIWKDIVGYDGLYQVSNLGRISSTLRSSRIRKPFYRKNWYVTTSLKGHTKSVHRLVAQAFLWLDIRDTKMFVCHKDDDKHNNKLDNLFLGTAKDNSRDMFNKWRQNIFMWEKSPVSKYTEKEILFINGLIKQGLRNIDIKRQTWYNDRLISHIRNKRRWKHIL